MSGQEMIALGVVGVTAAVFVWRLVVRRQRRGCGCGLCPGAGGTGRRSGFVVKGRKHEPARLLPK